MTTPARAPADAVTAVTLVTAPGCHFCTDAHTYLRTLVDDHAIELTVIEATSAEGRSLLVRHRPVMNPLVLIDGGFFSAGRLPRRKLQAFLQGRTAGTESATHG